MTDRVRRPPAPRVSLTFVLAALLIELVDELVDGAEGAAWPLLRQDFSLSYAQVGLLLTVPAVLANLIEPVLGLLADAGRRRPLVLGGGACLAASLLLTAVAGGFWPLLLSLLLCSPASGAFVTLTQAAWMDADPARREQNMARWTLAGSVGNVVGPLLISLAVTLGLGWRPVYALLAALAALGLVLIWPSPGLHPPSGERPVPARRARSLRDSASDLLGQVRRPAVWNALLLLQGSDLVLDVFRAFVALYFVDAVGSGAAQAGLAVAVLTGVGLLGDALAVPLLDRMSGVAFVRRAAPAVAGLLAAFLLLPWMGAKLAALGGIGLLTSGWYPVLQARLYHLLPGRGGAVMALNSLASLLGAGVPVGLGLLADRFGVQHALWLLMAGPLLLLWRLPASPWRR